VSSNEDGELFALWKPIYWLWIVSAGGRRRYPAKSRLQQDILEHTIDKPP